MSSRKRHQSDLTSGDLPRAFIHPQYGKPPRRRRRRKRKKKRRRNSKSFSALVLDNKIISQIIRRQKKAIVRAVPHQKLVGKDIYVCGDLAYGIINLNEPLVVDFDQFKNMKSRHLISDDEGEKLFEGRKNLYIYGFKIKKIFKAPRKYKKTQEKEFSATITLMENLRMYRFKSEEINSELLEKSDYEDLMRYQDILYGLYKRAKRRGETQLKAMVYSYTMIILKLLVGQLKAYKQRDKN